MSTTAPAIERFTLWCRFSHGHEAMGQSQGEFVRYTDHRAALDAAERRVEALRGAIKKYFETFDDAGPVPYDSGDFLDAEAALRALLTESA